jgi:hypothetical protein
MDVMCTVGKFVPFAFVRVSRGPWLSRIDHLEAFLGWSTGSFMIGLLSRMHDVATSCDAVATTRFARGLRKYHQRWADAHHLPYFDGLTCSPRYTKSHVGSNRYTPVYLEWVRLWCSEVMELLPREHARDYGVLRRMTHACRERYINQ